MKDREPIRGASKTFRAVARASLVATMVSACARPVESPYVPSETSLPTPTAEATPTHTPFSTPTEDPTLATDQAVSEILSSIAEEYGI